MAAGIRAGSLTLTSGHREHGSQRGAVVGLSGDYQFPVLQFQFLDHNRWVFAVRLKSEQSNWIGAVAIPRHLDAQLSSALGYLLEKRLEGNWHRARLKACEFDRNHISLAGHHPHLRVDRDHRAPEAPAILKRESEMVRLNADARRMNSVRQSERGGPQEIFLKITVHLVGRKRLLPSTVAIGSNRLHHFIDAGHEFTGELSAIRSGGNRHASVWARQVGRQSFRALRALATRR